MRKAGRCFLMMIIILLLIIELRAVVQLLFASLMLVLDGGFYVMLVLLWAVLVLFDVLGVSLLLCRGYRLLSHHEKEELNRMIPRCGRRRDNKAASLAAAIIHLGMNILSLIMVVSGSRSGLYFDTLGVVNTRINGFIIFLVCIWAINIVVIIIFQFVYIWRSIQSKA